MWVTGHREAFSIAVESQRSVSVTYQGQGKEYKRHRSGSGLKDVFGLDEDMRHVHVKYTGAVKDHAAQCNRQWQVSSGELGMLSPKLRPDCILLGRSLTFL